MSPCSIHCRAFSGVQRCQRNPGKPDSCAPLGTLRLGVGSHIMVVVFGLSALTRWRSDVIRSSSQQGVCRARDARAVVAPVRRLEPFACSVPLLQRDEREPRDGPDSLVRVRAGDIVRVEEGLNPFPRKSDRAGKWQVGVGCSRNRQCQGAEQAGQKAGVQPTLHRALQEGRPSSDLASLALSTAGATILFRGA